MARTRDASRSRSLVCAAPPDLDSHVGQPRDFPFSLWNSRALYPRAQTLAAMETYRMGQYLPLELVVVTESIAHLNLHRQHGGGPGVRDLRRSRLSWPRR